MVGYITRLRDLHLFKFVVWSFFSHFCSSNVSDTLGRVLAEQRYSSLQVLHGLKHNPFLFPFLIRFLFWRWILRWHNHVDSIKFFHNLHHWITLSCSSIQGQILLFEEHNVFRLSGLDLVVRYSSPKGGQIGVGSSGIGNVQTHSGIHSLR